MEFSVREEGHGSLEAHAHIWNHVFNFINSVSLKCAVELYIAEAIHKHGGQPVTLSQLVPALGIPLNKAAFVRRLMRLLTHSGYFTVQKDEDGEEAYVPTNQSQLLLWDNPHSISAFVVAMVDPLLLMPWQSLSAWFRGDTPSPFYHLNGVDFWTSLGQKPEKNSMFNEAMASDSRLMIDAVIREHGEVFRDLKSLVDVGGGNGATAIALAEAFPEMKCSVLDLSQVVASAPQGTAVEFISGDMFQHVPPANAVLLKWVLHNWSDEHCVKLLKVCKKAIPPKEEGGKVIIVDMLVSEDGRHDERTETQYFFDVLMMVINPGGKERGEDEWRKVCSDAGFSGYKIVTAALGLRAIIELYP